MFWVYILYSHSLGQFITIKNSNDLFWNKQRADIIEEFWWMTLADIEKYGEKH